MPVGVRGDYMDVITIYGSLSQFPEGNSFQELGAHFAPLMRDLFTALDALQLAHSRAWGISGERTPPVVGDTVGEQWL